MPEIKFTVSQAKVDEAIAAFNDYWSRDDVTAADIKRHMAKSVNNVVRSYRQKQALVAAAPDTRDVL